MRRAPSCYRPVWAHIHQKKGALYGQSTKPTNNIGQVAGQRSDTRQRLMGIGLRLPHLLGAAVFVGYAGFVGRNALRLPPPLALRYIPVLAEPTPDFSCEEFLTPVLTDYKKCKIS